MVIYQVVQSEPPRKQQSRYFRGKSFSTAFPFLLCLPHTVINTWDTFAESSPLFTVPLCQLQGPPQVLGLFSDIILAMVVTTCGVISQAILSAILWLCSTKAREKQCTGHGNMETFLTL